MSRHTPIAVALLLAAGSTTATGQQDPVDFYASEDIPVVNDGILNDYTSTHVSDGEYEGITEAKFHGTPKTTYLEHKWAIPVAGDPTQAWAFYLEAYHNPTDPHDRDDFDFAWSPDDVTYYHMLRVTKTSDDNTYQVYRFYVPLSGTVYVRVTDTNRSGYWRWLQDTIYVDHMYIENYADVTPPLISDVTADTVTGPAWVHLSPEVVGGTLEPRELHAMAYDSAADKTIAFGGGGESGHLADTWAYDYVTNTWEDRNPPVTGGTLHHRVGHAMVYDSAANRTIMFGGWPGPDPGELNDTWIYDYASNTWTNADPDVVDGPLAGRWHHAMVYDALADCTIMVGGVGSGCGAETWVYDYGDNTWYNMTPTMQVVDGDFQPRWGHSLAYDAVAGLTIMFGGQVEGEKTNETWAYDRGTNTWYNMTPTMRVVGDGFTGRYRHSMVYDGTLQQTVLFGGCPETGRANDTWTYECATNTWYKREPSIAGGTLHAREEHALVYDSTHGVTILFGGFKNDVPWFVNDTWMFTHEPAAVITWSTDELADSAVRYGTEAPPSTSVEKGTMGDHSVVLRSLEEYPAFYYYEVQSTDPWNNAEVDDNGGAYYTFTIGAPNNPPEAPCDPGPADGATAVGLDVDLSVYVCDPDGDEMDVSFYDEFGSFIDTDYSVQSGTRAGVLWEGLSADTTYGWYAVAHDSEASPPSAMWYFTTAAPQPPDAPCDPSPADGATAAGPDVDLSVYVCDPDGDKMDVSFWDAEAGVLIGTAYDVPSGTRASVSWVGLLPDTAYRWYAVAIDLEGSTGSATWHFTTEAAPPENLMHVAAIDMWCTTQGNKYRVYTKVTVVGALGAGVEGASVQLETALPGGGTVNPSGSTGPDGSVTLQYGPTRVGGTYTSSVTAVAKEGWIYDDGQNAETSETLTVP